MARTDHRPLVKNYSSITMVTENRTESDKWVQAFSTLGILREVHGSMTDLGIPNVDAHAHNGAQHTKPSVKELRKKSSFDIFEDSQLKEESKKMSKMVESYMKIVNTTIRDVTPKYIMLTLGELSSRTPQKITFQKFSLRFESLENIYISRKSFKNTSKIETRKILFSLRVRAVRATQKYAKKELVGDIFNGRQSDEAKAELLQASPDFEERMRELVTVRTTTRRALEIFATFK